MSDNITQALLRQSPGIVNKTELIIESLGINAQTVLNYSFVFFVVVGFSMMIAGIVLYRRKIKAGKNVKTSD
jgi:uncharacterized membrane protein